MTDDKWIIDDNPPEHDEPNWHTTGWLSREQLPALQWAVEGIVPEGFCILAGSPKVGKSWLVLSLCMAAASGGRALGAIPVKQRPTLLLALEDGHRRMQARITQLLAPGEPWPDFTYLNRLPIDSNAGTEIRKWLLQQDRPKDALVVVDTLQKARPPTRPGRPVYETDYAFASAVKAIADEYPGMSLLGIHHTRKGQDTDFLEQVSGSNGLTGGADTIAILARERGEDCAQLHVTGRDVDEQSYLMQRDPAGGWILDGGSLTAAVDAHEAYRMAGNLEDGSDSRTVLEWVLAHAGDHAPSDVALATGIERAGTYLSRHRAQGRLARTQRGRYQRP